MTRITLIIPVLLLTLLVGNPVFAADFQKGVDAAQKGDFATAMRELGPLAEQGDPRAQFNLGLMHTFGQGVPKDEKAAFKWFTLSAEQGYARAQYNLGLMYGKGTGTQIDITLTYMWWKLAASQGHKKATKGIAKLAKTISQTQLETAEELARNFVPKKAKDAIQCAAIYLITSTLTPLPGLPGGNYQAAVSNRQLQIAFERVFAAIEAKRKKIGITNKMISERKSEIAVQLGNEFDNKPQSIYALEMQCNAWREKIIPHLAKRMGNTSDANVIKSAFRSVPDIPEVPQANDPRWSQSKLMMDKAFYAWTKMGRMTPKSGKEKLKGK
jgi:hypothetical protein